MSLYSVSKAVLILLCMAVRYIFVCLSWKPLFKRSRGKQEGLKLYFNGDIILPEKANKDHQITVWKFQDFSVDNILREITFGKCRSSKTTVFTILGALNLVIW